LGGIFIRLCVCHITTRKLFFLQASSEKKERQKQKKKRQSENGTAPASFGLAISRGGRS